MGFYENQVLPRVIDVLCGNKKMEAVRAPVVEGLSGTVLEVGFGSGPNLGLYPPDVTRVLAVDPALVGRRLAEKRRARHPSPPVEYVGLDGAHLALPDDSVDHALSTWTMCTIPDLDSALAEIRRVLRPGGTLHFVEHGLSDDPTVARRQHRFEPMQKRFAGGCHLTRDIPERLRAAGYRVDRLQRFQLAGPKIQSSMWSGVAVPEASPG
ncbi:MAG: class I SAM-dependent methyltransferase [Acidimicrobiales bacterium]|nr:class I SAM-dependent methyltransferase [Acidimicrobiales bacterium]